MRQQGLTPGSQGDRATPRAQGRNRTAWLRRLDRLGHHRWRRRASSQGQPQGRLRDGVRLIRRVPV